MIEFMLTHYVPPFAYLMVFVLDRGRKSPGARRSTPEAPWWYRWVLLSQMSLWPAMVYSTHYDMKTVYGEGTKMAGMLIYGAISIVWAFGWSAYFKT